MGKRQRHGFIKSQYRVWDYRFFLYIRKNQERDSETDGDGSTCDSHLFLLYRKDRLWRSLELKNARTEAGTTTRRFLD